MMENVVLGFSLLWSWQNLAATTAGVILGILVGILPGLSASTGVALLLPFTFTMSPVASLALLAAVYSAAEYGGAITSIAIGMPGEPSAVPVILDGYTLTQQGEPGKALGIAVYTAVFGGVFSTIFLILLSVPLAEFALRFGPPEYFAMAVFGLTIVSSLSGRSWLKGFLATTLGLLIVTVGQDPFTGFIRFSFGVQELADGVGLVPVLLGLFATAEVFALVEALPPVQAATREMSSRLPTWAEVKETMRATWLGSVIGLIIGIIPGTGATIGAFIAYNEAKRFSRRPELFGRGSLEGVAAPTAATDSVVGGALIPMLTLGVPGSATAAVIMGALTIHGLTPGPELFKRNPDVVFGLFATLLLAQGGKLLFGLAGNRLWIKAIRTPAAVVAPLILGVAFIGSYAVGNSLGDVWVMLVAGVVGYLLRKLDFPLPPIVLALVLGFMMETSLRRSLLLSGGSPLIFVTRPISLGLLILAVVSFGLPFWRERREGARTAGADGGPAAA